MNVVPVRQAAACAGGAPARVRTLLGHYPNTAALKAGRIGSSLLEMAFDPSAKPAHAFKRAVQGEFDLAELSIVTFLIAWSRGYPLALLPAVMFSRMQHPHIVYDRERGPMAPGDLNGKRVGVAYYTTATSTWLRHILAEDHQVDAASLRWTVLETPHVPEFTDPPNVELARPGANLVDLLLAGEVDAAIMTPVPDHPRLARLIPDADAAADAWFASHGHLQLNHLIVTTTDMVQHRPDLVCEAWRMLVEAKREGMAAEGNAQVDLVPYGLDALAPHLEAAIDCIYRQRLIPRRPSVNELFGAVTASLRA